MTRHSVTAIAASALSLLMLSGCFTGVESTPRITPTAEQRKALAATSAEEQLMAQVAPQPLDQWADGKQFAVTDAKIYMVLSPAAAAQSLVAGSVLNYRDCSTSVNALGDSLLTLNFTTEGVAQTMSFTTPATQYPKIPFTVEQSIIDRANEALRGRTIYVLTSERLGGTTGSKLGDVTVTDVSIGNEDMPMVVRFRDNAVGDISAIRLSLSGSRTFANTFSLTDPHKAFPNITDEVWQNIRMGQVENGMTREECRLALGSTTDVTRINKGGTIEERWTYPNGVYLVFQDNVLTRFRR
jgi:hypothetical protein